MNFKVAENWCFCSGSTRYNTSSLEWNPAGFIVAQLSGDSVTIESRTSRRRAFLWWNVLLQSSSEFTSKFQHPAQWFNSKRTNVILYKAFVERVLFDRKWYYVFTSAVTFPYKVRLREIWSNKNTVRLWNCSICQILKRHGLISLPTTFWLCRNLQLQISSENDVSVSITVWKRLQ